MTFFWLLTATRERKACPVPQRWGVPDIFYARCELAGGERSLRVRGERGGFSRGTPKAPLECIFAYFLCKQKVGPRRVPGRNKMTSSAKEVIFAHSPRPQYLQQLIGNSQVPGAGAHVDVRLAEAVKVAAAGHAQPEAAGEALKISALVRRVAGIKTFHADGAAVRQAPRQLRQRRVVHAVLERVGKNRLPREA